MVLIPYVSAVDSCDHLHSLWHCICNQQHNPIYCQPLTNPLVWYQAYIPLLAKDLQIWHSLWCTNILSIWLHHWSVWCKLSKWCANPKIHFQICFYFWKGHYVFEVSKARIDGFIIIHKGRIYCCFVVVKNQLLDDLG